MWIARRLRVGMGWMIGTAAIVAILSPHAIAQQQRTNATGSAAPGVRAAGADSAAAAKQGGETEAPVGSFVRIPANPNDAVAIVNGEPITREQLASECILRHGKEVLDNLINQRLVDQAVRARKLQVTPAEIDQEIDRQAATIGKTDRKTWLLALSKNRGISPQQYAQDVIYRLLALRKLASPRVQVTDQDMQDAFEAYFGERLKCRMIMVGQQRHAVEIWEELRKNPGGFAKLASDDPRSIDQATRAAGGLMAEPLSRHAHPRVVSDSIFRQLVDGDPQDKDPSHKPKDGDFTGPIQVTESTWVIVKRESLEPARPHDKNNIELQQQIKGLIFEAKIQQEMNTVMDELYSAAAIDNKLVGREKKANEQQELAGFGETEVRTMSQPTTAVHPSPSAGAGGGAQPVVDPATVPASAPAPASGSGRRLPPGVTPTDVPSAVRDAAKAAPGAK